MNEIDQLIDTISIDAKQAEQMKALFKLAFISGMAFKKNIPDVDPQMTPGFFNSVYQMFLIASGEETVKMFNAHMKEYESGRKTDLV